MNEVGNEIAYKFAEWRERAQQAEAELEQLRGELADCREKLRRAQASATLYAMKVAETIRDEDVMTVPEAPEGGS